MQIASPSSRNRTVLTGFLLLLLAFAEVNCQAYWIDHNPAEAMSWLYLLTGLGVGVIGMRAPVGTIGIAKKAWAMPVALAATIAITLFCVSRLSDIVVFPLKYQDADMLPVIRVMNERMLRGEPVYAPIPEIWGGIQPVYLPGMFMPYGIAVAFGFDLRWLSVGLFLVGVAAVAFVPARKWRYPPLALPIFLLLLYPWMDAAVRVGRSLFTVSEEGAVVGCIGLLCAALFRGRGVWIGVCLAICALSRMNILPWALMFSIVFLLRDRKEGVKAAVSAAVLGVLLMTIAGSWGYLDLFLKLPDMYLQNMLAAPNLFEATVTRNLGLSKFFYPRDMALLHSAMKWVAFAVPLLCLGLMRPWRKAVDLRFFALGSLKVCMVAFYNLLLIPYDYLFHVSTVITVAIAFCWLGAAHRDRVIDVGPHAFAGK